MSALRNYEAQQRTVRKSGTAARQPLKVANPAQKPVRRVVKKAQQKPKKRIYTLRNMMVMAGIMTFGLMFGQLWMDSQITALHTEAQNIRNNIQAEYEIKSQLQSEIRELSSYTRVMEVATEFGLEVHPNSIVVSD